MATFSQINNRFPKNPNINWKIRAKGGDYKPCTTVKEAEAHKMAQAKSFKRSPVCDMPEALELANKYEQCTPKARCHGLDCPSCGLRYQKQFASATMEITSANSLKTYRASLVPNYKIRIDGLNQNIFRKLGIKLASACDEAEITHAIAGYDLSLNTSKKGLFESHWRAQAMLYFCTDDVEPIKEIFARHFVQTELVRRPTFFQKLDGYPSAFAYGFKPSFYKRITLAKTLEARQNSSKQTLSKPQLLNASRMLGDMTFGDRLFLRGFKLEDNGFNSRFIRL